MLGQPQRGCLALAHRGQPGGKNQHMKPCERMMSWRLGRFLRSDLIVIDRTEEEHTAVPEPLQVVVVGQNIFTVMIMTFTLEKQILLLCIFLLSKYLVLPQHETDITQI